jgi:hypothetical protein
VSIGQPQTGPKYIFQTPREARQALASDKLGTVYITVNRAFVVTCFGAGSFSRQEWEESKEDPL